MIRERGGHGDGIHSSKLPSPVSVTSLLVYFSLHQPLDPWFSNFRVTWVNVLEWRICKNNGFYASHPEIWVHLIGVETQESVYLTESAMQVFGEPCFESYCREYCTPRFTHAQKPYHLSCVIISRCIHWLPWWQCAFGRRPTTGLSQHSPQQFWSQGTIPCTHSASTEANANHTRRLIRKPTTSLPSVVPWGQDLRPSHPYVPHSLILSTQ